MFFDWLKYVGVTAAVLVGIVLLIVLFVLFVNLFVGLWQFVAGAVVIILVIGTAAFWAEEF